MLQTKVECMQLMELYSEEWHRYADLVIYIYIFTWT